MYPCDMKNDTVDLTIAGNVIILVNINLKFKKFPSDPIVNLNLSRINLIAHTKFHKNLFNRL